MATPPTGMAGCGWPYSAASQRAAVPAAFAQEGRPLHLRLAFEEARRWRSFEEVAHLPPIASTISGILQALFARLERPEEHRPVLASHIMGLLRAARNGLAEDELMEVLGQDVAIGNEQQTLAPRSPKLDPTLPLPAVLWACLYADLVS